MEEEKGGFLHVIFIMIGVALLSLGVFEYFTDEKIDLKEDPIYSNTENDDNDNKDDNKDEKDIISQINLIKNVDTKVTLKNNEEVTIRYFIDKETNKGTFSYSGKTSFETNELEICDKFYLYNNSIISYCVFGSATSGHLYIVDSNGDSTKVDSFKYNDFDMIPESISLKDEKLVINGISVLEGSIIKINDKEISLCNEEEVKENNISLELAATAEFELKITEEEVDYSLINIDKTIEEYIKDSCKTVE